MIHTGNGGNTTAEISAHEDPNTDASDLRADLESIVSISREAAAADGVGSQKFRNGDRGSAGLFNNSTVADEMALSFFLPNATSNSIEKNKRVALFGSSAIEMHSEGALLGHSLSSSSSDKNVGDAVYLNTHEPFCFVAVGAHGTGKSHTLSCVLESCLIPFKRGNIVKLDAPMTSLVLHFDQNPSTSCEAVGLLSPDPLLKAKMAHFGQDVSAVRKDNAVVLVSPAFYEQRKKIYGDRCAVKPLLFSWYSLTADHVRRILRIDNDDQPQSQSILGLLRSYQMQATLPDFAEFLVVLRKVCASSTASPRIQLLESMVAESDRNAALRGQSLELAACSESQLVIADMTDPFLSREDVNGLFQVLADQFRTLPTKGGKVICFDKAHKYMSCSKTDGLGEVLVSAARAMGRENTRLVVSTQSPLVLAPELLELVSVAALHHFHSPDWWDHLKRKLPLGEEAFQRILSLGCGEVLTFATSHDLSKESMEGPLCTPMRIRPRITEKTA